MQIYTQFYAHEVNGQDYNEKSHNSVSIDL